MVPAGPGAPMTPEQEIALATLEDRVLTLEIQVRDLQMRAGFELPKVP